MGPLLFVRRSGDALLGELSHSSRPSQRVEGTLSAHLEGVCLEELLLLFGYDPSWEDGFNPNTLAAVIYSHLSAQIDNCGLGRPVTGKSPISGRRPLALTTTFPPGLYPMIPPIRLKKRADDKKKFSNSKRGTV